MSSIDQRRPSAQPGILDAAVGHVVDPVRRDVVDDDPADLESLKPCQAFVRFVKTPVCSPNELSLTCRTASAKSEKPKTTTSGARPRWSRPGLDGTFSSTVGSKNAPFALPPITTLPPSSTASSTQRWVRCRAVVDHRADVRVRLDRVAELEGLDALDELRQEGLPDARRKIRWTLMQTSAA